MSETYTIGDKEFTLKGYTHDTEQEFQEQAPKIDERFSEGEIDRFQYYYELFKLVLDGPVEKLDPYKDIEARQAEDIIANFIPPSIRIYRQLIGF